jgi:hypothetical protein
MPNEKAYDDMMDKALDACDQSFTADITQNTDMYVALQDAVRDYVEREEC